MISNRKIRRKIEQGAEPKGTSGSKVWKILVFALVVIALVVLVPFGISNLTKGSSAEGQQPEPTPSVAPETPKASASPSPTDAFGTGPQAISNAPSASYAPVTIPPFKEPTVDTGNPESVAKAWAYVYHSRTSEDDIQRLQLTNPYVADALEDPLVSRSTDRTAPLAGLGASHMEAVKFSKNETKDTPIRWARNAEVTVQTDAGPKLVIEYEIQVNATDSGWQLTQASELGWTEKTEK